MTVNSSNNINEAYNLFLQLSLCVGARVMITVNVTMSGKLIKCSIRTIRYLDIKHSKPLSGQIYIAFDDPEI